MADSSVDNIITDPPYYTSNTRLNYKDTWKSEGEWLQFMEERIVECHRVLKDTGTLLIFISVHMQVELQALIYKIFSKRNFITTFIWKKKSSVTSQNRFAEIEHDYIIAVAKNKKKCKWNGIPQFECKDTAHQFMCNNVGEGRGNVGIGPNQNYPIYISATKISLTPFPGSIEINPVNGTDQGCWRAIPATAQKYIDANMLIVKQTKKGDPKIYQKQYAHFTFDKKLCKLVPIVRSFPIRTILLGDKYPGNHKSNAEIKKIFGRSAFTYSKPIDLIKNLIKIISNEGDTILDIFAGSGTTGQAAYETNRKFILIQLNENNIPQLTEERLVKTIGKDNFTKK